MASVKVSRNCPSAPSEITHNSPSSTKPLFHNLPRSNFLCLRIISFTHSIIFVRVTKDLPDLEYALTSSPYAMIRQRTPSSFLEANHLFESSLFDAKRESILCIFKVRPSATENVAIESTPQTFLIRCTFIPILRFLQRILYMSSLCMGLVQFVCINLATANRAT